MHAFANKKNYNIYNRVLIMTNQQEDQKKFKVLIVYPNLPLMLVPSLAVALFTNILKTQGYTVDLFETTGYLAEVQGELASPENRVKFSQARAFDYEEDLGVKVMHTNMYDDFRERVLEFKPDFMILSVVEDAFIQAVGLLESVADLDIPHLMGGVFPTNSPDVCLEYDSVKWIGLHEGEKTVQLASEAIRLGLDCKSIPGTWYKDEEENITKNARSSLVNINEFRPDFSLFDQQRFYRPMGGRIFKTVPVETYRGCPYTCTFCNSPHQMSSAKEDGLGNFLRRKPMNELRNELRDVVDKYDPEFLYFIDDSFLARPRQEIFDFCDMYEEFKLPFWFNTRPENCRPEIMKRLHEVGAYRTSYGIECGNEEYRRKVLLRSVGNKKIIEQFRTIAEGKIPFSLNLIIGFPGETRDLVMDTIELVRSIDGYDTLTVSIYTAYHGSQLREIAIRNNWIDPKQITKHTTSSSMLTMPPPYLSADDIDGLIRVVPLYCYFPKENWPEIRRAEVDDEEGNKILAKYTDIYQSEFLSMKPDEKKNILIQGGSGCRSNAKDSFFVSPVRMNEEELNILAP